MIKKLSSSHHTQVMLFLKEEAAFNLFILGDIEQNGYECDFQSLYGEFEQGEIKSVLLHYHNALIYYAKETRDSSPYKALLESLNYDFISGKHDLIEAFKGLVMVIKEKPMYFCEMSALRPMNLPDITMLQVKTVDHLRCTHTLRQGIKEFRKISWEDYYEQNKYRLKETQDLTFAIEGDGQFIATASTAATNSTHTMVVGVATDPHYRGKSYASTLVTGLAKVYLSKGLNLCLFYDNPSAGRIYEKLGFKTIGKWQMLTVVKEEKND